MQLYSQALQRAQEYAKRRSLSIERQIGGGTQGVVLATDTGTAIKALIREDNYIAERNVYLRLRENEIDEMCGFNVPRLIDYHDELFVVEMQIVTPPYVLDFASAYLDSEPPYLHDKRIMRDWENGKQEEFESRWPTVRTLLARFKGIGIHLADVKLGNIMFEDG